MTKILLAALALGICFTTSSNAAPAPVSNYAGELNGIPVKAWLWWEGDDVVGFLNRLDGKPMTMRLAGENHTQGKMTLKAMQGYGDAAILRLTRKKEGGTTVWSGVAEFKEGVALTVVLKKI